MSKNKDNRQILIVAVVILIIIVVVAIFKKLFNSLNTEPTVLDEASKKILNDKKLLENYYEAIEKEKRGENVDIIIDGEKYKITRAGKYNQPIGVQ